MQKRWMCRGVLTLLLSVGMLGGVCAVRAKDSSVPAKILISDVIITGNQRMSTEQIKVRLRTQAGREYNPATVDDDVRELYKTNQFSNIATFVQDDGPSRAKIYFKFRDMPNVVQKVIFQGAKHIKDDELKKITGVQTGMSLNPDINRKGCQKILDKYEEMGRSFSSCQLLKGGDPGDTEVVYQITEGPKVKVRDIQFIDSTFVSGSSLATQIKALAQWLHFIGGFYIPAMDEVVTKELVKYFRRFGYQDVKVALEKQRSADGGEITLIFHIQEGKRYRVNVEKTEAERMMRVGQIFLHGNERTSDESILAHVPLFPGQMLNYPELRKAEKDLAKLGLFVVDPAKGVRPKITVVDADGDNPWKDLIITVKEKAKKNTPSRSP